MPDPLTIAMMVANLVSTGSKLVKGIQGSKHEKELEEAIKGFDMNSLKFDPDGFKR